MKRHIHSITTKPVYPIQNQKLVIVGSVIILGFAISVFYHYFMGTFMHRGLPFNTFLFHPGDQFNDFFNFFIPFTSTGKGVLPIDHNFNNYLIYLPSLFSFHSRGLTYLFYAGIFILYLFFFNYFNIKKHTELGVMDWSLLRDSFIFTFMTYPVLFAIDRGNCDMYIFIIVSVSLVFYYNKKILLSALLLGLAVHIKIYFAVFLLVYFTDKKYKEIGIVILLFFILPFLVLIVDKWVFPTVQFSDSVFVFLTSAASSSNSYNNVYVLGDGGAAFCSSLYGGLKAIIYFLHPDIKAGSLPILNLFRLYFPLAALCAGIITAYMLFFEKEAWRKVALASLALILFPFVTADYRLIMLLIPIWMFINSKEQSNYNVLYATIFGLLLIPKNYYIIRDWISISVIINPLLIIIFMMSIMHEGISRWANQHSYKLWSLKKLALVFFVAFIFLSIILVLRG